MALVLVIDKGKRLPCPLRQNPQEGRDRKGRVGMGSEIGSFPDPRHSQSRQRGRGENCVRTRPGLSRGLRGSCGSRGDSWTAELGEGSWTRYQLGKTLTEGGRGGGWEEYSRSRKNTRGLERWLSG